MTSCKVCGKGFFLKETLTLHMTTHVRKVKPKEEAESKLDAWRKKHQ